MSTFQHGHSRRENRTPEYRTWLNMKDRCVNPNNKQYQDYGGRNITVCNEWVESYEQFYEDMGSKPSPQHSIDRIDNDKGYSPDNCRWATTTEQNRNQRLRKDNTSGVRGVFYNKNNQNYRAYISVKGRKINLGSHASLEDATQARKQAEIKYWSESA